MLELNILEQILAKAIEAYNIEYYAFFQKTNETASVLHTYPKEWVQLYLENNYDKYDIAHSKTKLPISWDADCALGLQNIEREIFRRAYYYNIRAGYTIPVLMSDTLCYLTFAKGGDPMRSRNYIDDHKYMFQALAQVLPLVSFLKRNEEQRSSAENIFKFIQQQEEELGQLHRRKIEARSLLLSASDLVGVFPRDLGQPIEELIEMAYSALEKNTPSYT